MTHSLFSGKKIAILGYGIEGQSTLRFLLKNNVLPSSITILDRNPVTTEAPIQTITGPGYLDSLTEYDLVFKTPGITKQILSQQTNIDLNTIPFTSQTQIFFDWYQGKTVGVTGTKGKSTSVSLIYQTLQRAGVDVVLAGNIGTPVLDLIDFDKPPTVVIYELSSFMLESLQDYTLTIGVFNTLYTTHIGEHGSIDEYYAAKLSIQDHAQNLFIGSQVKELIGDHITKPHTTYGETGTYTYNATHFLHNDDQVVDHTAMKLLGDHNKYNCSGVFGVIDLLQTLGISGVVEAFKEEICHFTGLEHRIEYVGEYGGRIWYNDAIATTPQATCAAIKALGNEVGALLYGGIEGEYNHSLVAAMIEQSSISTLVLFPDTGHHIKNNIDISQYTILETRSMEEAVTFAAKHAKPGSIVLLSCGSPSYSCRKNYKEKGMLFKECAMQLP